MDDSLTLLVDAPSLMFRALFSTPDSIRMPDGRPINAAYGFLQMLARLIGTQDPDYIACADDVDWRPEWRVKLLPSYKSHRAEQGSAQEEAEEILAHQVPAAYKMLELCGITVAGSDGYEAEDIIGTLAERAPGRVAIFSGDRDLFQLVEDPKTVVLYPIRGVSKLDVVDERFIEDKYGIPGRAYRDFAVLRGDPSDGLPGVRGIGEKLASLLIVKHANLDNIIELAEQGEGGTALQKVARSLDYVKKARQVVTIATDAPLPDLDLTRPRTGEEKKVVDKAHTYGLRTPVKNVLDALYSKS